MNIRILRSSFNLELLAQHKVPTHIVSKSAECCNPTSPFKTQSCRRHPRVVVDAIENLQRAFKGEIGVPHPQRSPSLASEEIYHFSLPPTTPTSSILWRKTTFQITAPLDHFCASTQSSGPKIDHRRNRRLDEAHQTPCITQDKISQIVHQQQGPNCTLTFGDSNSA